MVRSSILPLLLLALPAFFTAGCQHDLEGVAVPGKDGLLSDGGLDQAVADSRSLDGSPAEGLKPDAPPADKGLDAAKPDAPPADKGLDALKPDAPDLFTKDSAPDTAACPSSNSVWGKMFWGGGCLWQ